MQNLKIYCDGSCNYRSRLGGIGVYIQEGEKEYMISKGYMDTTISRMEGIALLSALKSLSKEIPINAEIISDSEYIIKSFSEGRLSKWQMIDFAGVANVDMWKAILKEINDRPLLKLKFTHVRGHGTDLSNDNTYGNNFADLLANYKTKKEYISDKLI